VHKSKRFIAASLVVATFLVVFILSSRSITSRSRVSIQDASATPLRAVHSISEAIERVVPFAGYRARIARLRGEAELLKRRVEESRLLLEENDRLKDLIAFRKTVPYSTIPAEVIGRDPSNWSNSVIIDKGAAGGIRQNRAVLSTRGLVGRVVEVGRYSSRILLITDPNSRVGVVVQRNRQGGMLTGGPDGRCRMIYIALDSDVAKGDSVVTAGYGTIYPRGIIVGSVSEVGREPGRLYKYAVVAPAQEMSRLEEVLCIR
jgi:rod shape-determining protein MreC